MWGSSESEDKGADLDTLMCLLILSFIVDLRISTRLFTFLFLLQHEAQGSGLLHSYVTATFFYNLFILNQGAWIFMHTTQAWWHLFHCCCCFFSFFVLIWTNSVNNDNEREVFCYAQVKGWYGNIFTDSQRTLLFPFCALQQNSYFKSKASFFLFSHAFVMETNSQKYRASSTFKCCTHVYRISVCCTGCLSNAYLNAYPTCLQIYKCGAPTSNG